MAKTATSSQEEEKVDLLTLAERVRASTPPAAKTISVKRARAFMQILAEIGIGDLINTVVRDKMGGDNPLRPVTAAEQGAAVRKINGMESVERRILDIQMHFDYQELTARLSKGDVFERMICVVLDVENPEEANFAEFGDVFPFFVMSFSRVYSGLTSFVVQLA